MHTDFIKLKAFVVDIGLAHSGFEPQACCDAFLD